jgi:hypothetical protein
VSEKTGRASADYLLRTAQQNALALSAMADQKASVIMGAAFVIASIVLPSATTDGVSAVQITMGITSVVAGLLAALSLLPGHIKKGPPFNAESNPLFYGAVANMTREDYLATMNEIIEDDAKIYDAILWDIHASLHAPARKFQMLRYSYISLMVGMVASLLLALPWSN